MTIQRRSNDNPADDVAARPPAHEPAPKQAAFNEKNWRREYMKAYMVRWRRMRKREKDAGK